jgi:hypothetical protein
LELSDFKKAQKTEIQKKIMPRIGFVYLFSKKDGKIIIYCLLKALKEKRQRVTGL